MFEVGFTEIVLIMGLALLVLGPEKLPGLARKVGRWTGRARSMARQLRMQLEQEVTLDEASKSSRPAQASRPSKQNDPAPAPAEVPDPIAAAPQPDDASHVDQPVPEAEPVMHSDTAPEKTPSQ